jgi:hypothetical protein
MDIEEGLDDVPESSASPLTPTSPVVQVESLPDVFTSHNTEVEDTTRVGDANVDTDAVTAMRLAESLAAGGVFWGKPDEVIKTSDDIEREATSLNIVETTLKRLGPIHAGTVLGMYADLDSSKLYGEECFAAVSHAS